MGPALVHANLYKQYFLKTDASGVAIRAVLSQRDDEGHLKLIAFMSQGLTKPQLNYDTHNKELLVIVEALLKWRIYLEGTKKPIIILTDHQNLLYWKEAHNHNHRHNHWYHILGPHNLGYTIDQEQCCRSQTNSPGDWIMGILPKAPQ